jgi:hypothetical protein
MSADSNLRYLPTAAAQKVAELERRLEMAQLAAKINAETIRVQQATIADQKDRIDFLSENSNVAAVIKENAVDLLTAALQSADDIRIPVKAKRYRCEVLGHLAASPTFCHERKPHLVTVEEQWSLRDVLCDFDAMPAREQASMLIEYAFGETVLNVRCPECGERNSECVCPR